MNRALCACLVVVLLLTPALAEQAAPLGALARMPVKEVTVFKDGHAFVAHAGKMPVDAAGNVLMDYLPTPVMGTFWPYSSEKNVKLTGVLASDRRVLVERTALTIRELLEANVGAEATFVENVAGEPGKPGLVQYSGKILSIPERSSDELDRTNPPNSPPALPQKGNIVLIKLEGSGTKAVNIDNIRDVTFRGEVKQPVKSEELRHLLTLKLDWGGKPGKEADVGVMYLQRGLRWIPTYKITLDGKGSARIQLQAMLINELCDMEDVTANLVVGVPTFAFKDMLDPISMQGAMAQLSGYFRDGQTSRQMLLNGNFSNSIMTQVADQETRGMPEGARAADLGPEIGAGAKSEDLFVFTVTHLTLRKGQRMAVSVAECEMKYRDVFRLDIPVAPPPEVWQRFDSSRQAEVARIMAAPKVVHYVRLVNDTKTPLTTAPALILRDSQVLGQGMMTYTPAGGSVDLSITTAVDVLVNKTDKETKRTPNAANWEGNTYARIDLAGTIKLTNMRDQPVEVEVVRHIIGNVNEVGQDGKAEMLSAIDSPQALAPSGSDSTPNWWGWYSWPGWWYHFNGVGRFNWKLTLDKGKATELTYSWYYLWR